MSCDGAAKVASPAPETTSNDVSVSISTTDRPRSTIWSKTHRLALLGLALLLAASVLFQGQRGLYSPDEGRYVGVALEMLDSGDWLHPRLHPDAPHYTKPPLTYWAIAASMETFGRSEWAARLPIALAWLATILLVVATAQLLIPGRAPLAGMIYATFLLPSLVSNVVTTDSLLALWTTLYAYAFIAGRQAPTVTLRRAWVSGAWAAAGLAFLTKGPPALLLLCGLLIFAALDRKQQPLRQSFSVLGLGLFALIAGSWFALIIHDQPQLLRYFVLDETAGRIFSGAHGRHPVWYGGFYVYLPTLLLGALPWSAVLLLRLGQAIRRREWVTQWRRNALLRLLLCWILLPLLVFMLARSRLPLYLMPLFAPLAIAAAAALSTPTNRRWWVLGAASAVILLLLRLGAGHLSHPQDDRALSAQLRALVPEKIDELVFVDTAARYGTRLYLNVPIERANSGRDQTPRPNADALATEIAELHRCRVLLVLSDEVPALQADLSALSAEHQLRGQVPPYSVLTPKQCAP